MTGVQNKYSLAPIIYSFTSGGVAAGALISERPSSLDYIALIPGQYSELRIDNAAGNRFFAIADAGPEHFNHAFDSGKCLTLRKNGATGPTDRPNI